MDGRLRLISQVDLVLSATISRVVTIAKRYDKTLSEIENETQKSRENVRLALERMGYQW